MFTMEACPHCQRAHRWMAEAFEKHPEYKEIPLTIIDEVEQPALADTYDYYYVPTYYVGGAKVHEGVASPEIIENAFSFAIKN